MFFLLCFFFVECIVVCPLNKSIVISSVTIGCDQNQTNINYLHRFRIILNTSRVLGIAMGTGDTHTHSRTAHSCVALLFYQIHSGCCIAIRYYCAVVLTTSADNIMMCGADPL